MRRAVIAMRGAPAYAPAPACVAPARAAAPPVSVQALFAAAPCAPPRALRHIPPRRQCEPRRSGADEFAAVTSFAEARPPSTVRQKIKASAQKMLLLHAKTPRNANPNATANAASSLAVCG